MANVESRELGAAVFADATIEALRSTGLPLSDIRTGSKPELAKDDIVVVMNIGGSWHGAVAMHVSQLACEALCDKLYGRKAKSCEECAEAMMEAANMATGRGVAALGTHSEGAVWLTPPLCVKCSFVTTRLHNTQTSCHTFKFGEGQVSVVFAAAEKEIPVSE